MNQVIGPLLQSTAVVFAAVVAANIAKTYQGAQVAIAERQARVDETKLKMDLFELRFVVYQEIMTIFDYFYFSKHLEASDSDRRRKIEAFDEAIKKAKIVFPPAVTNFLIDIELFIALIRSDYVSMTNADDTLKKNKHFEKMMENIIKLHDNKDKLDAAFVNELKIPNFDLLTR